jgi:hypothetical protein
VTSGGNLEIGDISGKSELAEDILPSSIDPIRKHVSKIVVLTYSEI